MRLFSSADGQNPLSDFKDGTIRALKVAEERQYESQQLLVRQMGELEKQLQALRLEKEKLEDVAAERERGTAKGRTFEQLVADTVDDLAVAQGDVAEAVGDFREATGKRGDVVVGVDGCAGPARGRLVFEAKDSRMSTPAALRELDEAMAERSADFAVLVVPTEGEVPAKLEPLREYNGDKLVVALDPEGGTLPLALAYRLARARVLMQRGDGEGIDAGAVRDTVERAIAALGEERKIKQQLTGAKTGIDRAYDIVGAMGERVRGPAGGDRRAGAQRRRRPPAAGGDRPAGALTAEARRADATIDADCNALASAPRAAAGRRSSCGAPCRSAARPDGSPRAPPPRSPRSPRRSRGRASCGSWPCRAVPTGPTSVRWVSPSRMIVWRPRVWLEIVIRTGPAPTRAGETVTASSWTTPVSSIGIGGRGSLAKSSSPQPAISAAAIPAVTTTRALIPGRI